MRSAPLKRRKGLKKSRGPNRSKPIKPISPKRRKINRLRKKVGAQLADQAGGRCQIRMSKDCRGFGTHTHEKLTRARGGSIVDPTNQFYCCFPCNQWCHENPKEAERLGFLVSGYFPITPVKGHEQGTENGSR